MKKLLSFLLIISSTLFFCKAPYITIVVSQDGKGDFLSIQKAINSIRDLGSEEALIKIKKGIYKEKLVIGSSKQNITLEGEDSFSTIITYDDHTGKIDICSNEAMNTFNSYSFLISGDQIRLRNLTVQNSTCGLGQGVALHVEGDKFVAENCRILGCQDTLYLATNRSRQFYKNCFIEGTTDFIFGQATVVFKNCEIKSLSNSYITAASTEKDKKYGFVFIDCKLTAKDGVDKVYLGRPWRPYAKTVYVNTQMANHILPEGWNPWKGDKMFVDKEKTCFYAEFGSYSMDGKTDVSKRVDWSNQLTESQVKEYVNINNVLSGNDSWNPIK